MGRMIDVVLLDLMGTVVYDPYLEALEAATGLGFAQAAALRDPGCWPAFELGEIDEGEFVRRFFLAPDAGHEFNMAAFHRVRREGYRFLPGMRETVEDLDGVVDRYIASNYPVWIDEMHSVFDFDRLFEGVYASCRLGLRKPDPRFFTAILDDLGVAPEHCLFVDDRAANCAAASTVGLVVHTFTDAEDLRVRLQSEGITLP